MRWKNIDWRGCHLSLDDAVLATAERVFGVHLPDDYWECARLCHGGQPTENAFAFDDPEIGRMESCLGVLLSFSPDDPENIFEAYESLRPFLPEGAIPIADDGGGDFMCLDYSHGSPPSIGYWHHGESSLVPLAPNFSEFLSMLYGESPEFQPRQTHSG